MDFKSIDLIQPINNYVLVELSNTGNNRIEIGGHNLVINTSFHPEHHVNVVGRVIMLPKELTYRVPGKKSNFSAMPWKTKHELCIEKGDLVWIDYIAVMEALGNLLDPLSNFSAPRYIIVGQKLYVFIHYARLYMRQRNGENYMLNGFVGVSQTETKEIVKSKAQNKIVRVEIIGDPLISDSRRARPIRFEDIMVGDLVAIKKAHSSIPIEKDIHRSLDKHIFATRPHDILAIISSQV